jgi:hypothetical protein
MPAEEEDILVTCSLPCPSVTDGKKIAIAVIVFS